MTESCVDETIDAWDIGYFVAMYVAKLTMPPPAASTQSVQSAGKYIFQRSRHFFCKQGGMYVSLVGGPESSRRTTGWLQKASNALVYVRAEPKPPALTPVQRTSFMSLNVGTSRCRKAS